MSSGKFAYKTDAFAAFVYPCVDKFNFSEFPLLDIVDRLVVGFILTHVQVGLDEAVVFFGGFDDLTAFPYIV